MFAVPGWSVSASLLKTQSAASLPQPNAKDAEERTKSKKRKRGKQTTVTAANVSELWQQHFEGKKPEPKKSDAARKDVKRLKVNGETPSLNQHEDAVALVKGAKAETGTKKSKKLKDQLAEPGELKGDTAAPGEVKEGIKDKQKKKNNVTSSTDQLEDGKSKNGAPAAKLPPPAPAAPPGAKLTPMQSAMRQKLISARFRHLNQTLYTAPSSTSLSLFAESPEIFEDYHSGFRQQVSTWPENPVDNFIRTLRDRGKLKLGDSRNKKRKPEFSSVNTDGPAPPQPLTRSRGTCTIADLGCGDARLASTLEKDGATQRLNLKIHSYDLHSNSPYVTKADIAKLPLQDGTVDVAIFCLALMGTNWIDFIEEAYRVLHWKGELWIAEIKSRFGRVGGDKAKNKVVEHSVGSKRKVAAKQKAQESDKKEKNEKDEEQALQVEVDGVESGKTETDVSGFVEVLARRGFVLKDDKAVDLSNKMFVKMEFIKAAPAVVGKNVQAAEREKEEGTGGNWKMKQTKPKFLDNVKEVAVEDEAKVLKPCLYKIR